jgi:hypothetical protein
MTPPRPPTVSTRAQLQTLVAGAPFSVSHVQAGNWNRTKFHPGAASHEPALVHHHHHRCYLFRFPGEPDAFFPSARWVG